MDVELIEIREFMAEHPPFDQLPENELDRLPRELSVRYLRRGTPFPPADADKDYLYIVRKGALELRDGNGELVDKFGEGELYPAACGNTENSGHLQALTAEDSLFYLLPCEYLNTLRERYPAFNEHFEQPFNERLRHALNNLREPHSPGLMTVELAELVSRAPVWVTPDTSIQAAARLMSTESISALMVMEQDRLLGILTDRDLRTRVVAEALPYDRPVSDIMSHQLFTVARDTLGFEALLTMTRLNVHHLPVMNGDGSVLGMISSTDLMLYQSANAVFLCGDVRECDTVQALAQVSGELPRLQQQLVTAGASAWHVGQAISSVTDALTIRLLQLAELELGPPPVPYVWCAVGSQARREQMVHADQDSALILSDDAQPEHDTWFAALARFVTDGLAACGFPYCPGKVMASNPEWRQPLRVWREYFNRWIGQPEHKALMLASNFFDMRALHGEEPLWLQLHAEALCQAREDRIFLAHLAANALRCRPPLGFFRQFVLIGEGKHAKTFDLKHRGILPVIELARVYALAAGLPEINTSERLRAAAEAMALSREGAENLEHALEFIATLRARHQARQIRKGEAPDNYLRPGELSALERHHLKDAFAAIRTQQNALAQRFQTERFI